MNDDLVLAMSVLADVLGDSKFRQIDKSDVIKELSEVSDSDHTVDYAGAFHPYRRIDIVVKHFATLYKKRKLSEDIKTEELDGLDSESVNAEDIEEAGEDMKAKLLTSLITVYPDVDPKFLQQICARLQHDAGKIQDWLESNIDQIPEKRTVQAINRFELERRCGREEQIWKCPTCEMWQIIPRHVPVVKCSEVVSCGEFCTNCNRRSHEPFKCRGKCMRIDTIENEVNIFKKLMTPPDEDKGYAKIFIIRPQNNLNFSDPLHILYLAAEGTFLRMIEMSNQAMPSPMSSAPSRTTNLMSMLHAARSGFSSFTRPTLSAPNIPSIQVPGARVSVQGSGGLVSSAMVNSSFNDSPMTPTRSSSGTSSSHGMPAVSPPTATMFSSGGLATANPPTAVISSSVGLSAFSLPTALSSASSGMIPGSSPVAAMGSLGRINFSGRSVPIMRMGRKTIKAIKYIENESLRCRFNSCKSYFLSRGIPNGERLVFHGTSANIDSIIKNNLKLSHCKRFAHGYGIYFSEFPSISQGYGMHLLLCRVMLGNPYQDSGHKIPEKFQSKIVRPNEVGKANMIVIHNEDQILPAFIVELEDSAETSV